ncbi:hypothetical protein PG616_01180 [Riemerella anatipestifer]|nr:hypothetical protein [Riemerella anatipestifer]
MFLKEIIKAYLLMLVYFLDFYSPEEKAILNKRKEACKDCELRSRAWCSKNKEHNGIKGCGCYIHAKQHSRAEPQNKLCPLNKWLPFGI